MMLARAGLAKNTNIVAVQSLKKKGDAFQRL